MIGMTWPVAAGVACLGAVGALSRWGLGLAVDRIHLDLRKLQ